MPSSRPLTSERHLESHQALGAVGQKLGAARESVVERHGTIGQREGGRDPLVEGGLPARCQPPGQYHNRHAVSAGQACHTHRCLAGKALAVELALAGDHQVGIRQQSLDADLGHHQFDAGSQLGAEKRPGGEAHASRCAGPGQVAMLLAQCRGGDVGEARQGGIEARHLLGCGTLLGTEYRAGATLAQQRVVDVHRGLYPQAGQARVETGEVGEGGAALRQLTSLAVAQSRAEGRQHSRTGVIGGASAEGEKQPVGTGVKRLANQLADTEGGAVQGGALVGRQRLQATDLGQLHISGATLGMPSPVGPGPASQGIMDVGGTPLGAGGGKKGVEAPLAAIGQGTFQGLDIAAGAPRPDGDGARRIGGGQGILEAVGADEDLHGRAHSSQGRGSLSPAGVRQNPVAFIPARIRRRLPETFRGERAMRAWWLLLPVALAGCQLTPATLPEAQPAPSAECRWPVEPDDSLASAVTALEAQGFLVRHTDVALGLVSAELARTTFHHHHGIDPLPRLGGFVLGGTGGRLATGVTLGIGGGISPVVDEATRLERVSVMVGSQQVRVSRDIRLVDWRGEVREARSASDAAFCKALHRAMAGMPAPETP